MKKAFLLCGKLPRSLGMPRGSVRAVTFAGGRPALGREGREAEEGTWGARRACPRRWSDRRHAPRDGGHAEKENKAARQAVQQELSDWLQDADLASVRDARELTALPPQERRLWEKLWQDVAALLKKCQ